MRHSINHIAALIAAIGSVAPAAAETRELTLDSVVVTGSRIEQKSFDVPAAIDVVGRERIAGDNARVNASESLAGVPGISVANRQN